MRLVLRLVAALTLMAMPLLMPFTNNVKVVKAATSYDVTVSATPDLPMTLLPPSNFTVTDMGGATVNITWTPGNLAEGTIIRVARDEYPDSVTDGELVYSGNGTEITYTIGTFDLTNYRFVAYSYNGSDTSAQYASDDIGGEAVILLSIVVLALGVSMIAVRYRHPIFGVGASAAWAGLMAYVLVSTANDTQWHLILVICTFTFIVAMLAIGFIAHRMQSEGSSEEREPNFLRRLISESVATPQPRGRRRETADEYTNRVRGALERGRKRVATRRRR